jgi:DNA invertase Pin-like site-specific DNA recombinase
MIGYLRVSTEEQGRSGLGLGAQRAAIADAASARGWEVEWVQDPGYSAKALHRPGLEYALERLRSGTAEGLVVAKVDRLSRSLGDFCGLIQRAEREGWALVVLDPPLDLTTPAGRMLAHVLGAFAEFEREMIGQRTREGLAVAKANGKRLGRPARMKPDVVARIVRERAEGRSLGAIAAGLNADGVPRAHGGRAWYPTTVRMALRRLG